MRHLLTTLLATLLALVLTGCGYHFSGQASGDDIVLDSAHRKLCIRSVENPTLKPWLESLVRSRVRDEFTKRQIIEWASVKDATADMYIDVTSFTSNSSLKDSDDVTVKSSANINLTAKIVSRETGETLWSSGNVSASQTFTTARDAAERRVVDLALRRLADRLFEAY